MDTKLEPEQEGPEDSAQDKLTGKQYVRELRKLQEELCAVQEWVKYTGQRIVLVFEGRDAAGKGGLIRALTERVSPRVFRDGAAALSVALAERMGFLKRSCVG